jgi:D-glycero-beta-D-manno-heptose-7-phosphate kinase
MAKQGNIRMESRMKKNGRILDIVKNFSHRRILVVGDVMLDHYLWGNVERISPEAPVPVVQVDREEMRPGGAANVALNLIGLGAKASLAGMIGEDQAGNTLIEVLRRELVDTRFLAFDKTRPTTVKTRIIAHNQQVVRFDKEMKKAAAAETVRELLRRIRENIDEFHAVIVSDYGKGVVGKMLMDGLRVVAKAARIPIAVDPKIRNVAVYKCVDLITPNHHEAGEMLGTRLINEDKAVESAGNKLVKRLDLQCLLITRAALGMSLFRPGRSPTHIPTVARQVFDVTGAGDSVIAATTLARVSGAGWEESASIANQAAGIVVGKVGTAVVTAKELKEALRRFHQ